MQRNMTMMVRVIINGMVEVAWQYFLEWLWKYHIIGRYGGCFEERYMVALMYRRKLCGTREASNGGRVRLRIIHGLNISHKELTYLLQKNISYRNKLLHTCS